MWTKGDNTTRNIFTNNLSVIPFEKHGSKFYGSDQFDEKKTKSAGQVTNQAGVIGSTRTTNGLKGIKHAAAAINITVPINSLDDTRNILDYYQQVFNSLIEAPTE